MEWAWSFLFWPSIILSSTFFLLLLLRHRRHQNSASDRLPPGPPRWPVFSHMFDLGKMPHHTLTELKDQYGSVIWLRIGTVNTRVVLTTKAATELFKNHDLSFAERSISGLMRVHDYHKGSLALAPYGTYWRVLRRICTVEMLVVKRINETVPVRRKCVDNMLTWIEEQSSSLDGACGVHVARFVFLASFNIGLSKESVKSAIRSSPVQSNRFGLVFKSAVRFRIEELKIRSTQIGSGLNPTIPD
ncbi:hypothetical protein HYC85_006815 [Camellia sinensis]|uniref:Cytochrome P450 n=1 Tax=Camellia sinensis TaxID=4442 RepID=A0A7J7HMJ1_CAMSI|nr:hypothetical protein HYC85_006815 [Camellia sinensis]